MSQSEEESSFISGLLIVVIAIVGKRSVPEELSYIVEGLLRVSQSVEVWWMFVLWENGFLTLIDMHYLSEMLRAGLGFLIYRFKKLVQIDM